MVAGVVTLWDTTSYTDTDSQVFPRAAAILLIVCASIALISGLVATARSAEGEAPTRASAKAAGGAVRC